MKKILIFLMSAAVAVSCSDDIFDVDPSGKVSSETRDEVAKEDPDKVLQGIEASIYTHYATYYKNDLQWLTGFKGFELAFGMAGQDMTLLLQHSMNLYMYINDYWQEEYTLSTCGTCSTFRSPRPTRFSRRRPSTLPPSRRR